MPRCKFISGRNTLRPDGFVGYGFVQQGNVLYARTILWAILSACLGLRFFDRAAFRVLSFRHAPISMDAFRDEGLTTWLRACLFSSCAHFSAWRYILAHSTWGEWAGPHPRCTGCGRTTRCWWTRSSRKRGQCHARSNQS